MEKSTSRETLDETFESLTPYIPEEAPQIEQVDTPPLVSTPKSEHSKFKNKLSALTSPFKTSKGFNLGAIKRSKLVDKEEDSDRDSKEAVKKTKKANKNKQVDNEELGVEFDGEGALSGGEEKRKKKSGARSKAGALVKRLGSLRGKKPEATVEPAVDERRASSGSSSLTPGSVKRRTSDCEDGPASEPSINDESGSRYGSVEDVDMSAPIADAEEPIPIDISAVSTTHPVSTLPFAKSTWKPKAAKSFEIERPIESPSPEDALRRRIAFVEQTTICISEDRDDSPYSDSDTENKLPTVPRLSRMVQLAKTTLTPEGAPKETRSRSPSPNRTVEKTDDEDYEDTEEPTPVPRPVMTAYGDLIEEPSTSTADMGNGASASTPSLSADKREHLYKILVIGELGAGKTSIIKRYVHQFFSQHYRATIGVDFALKVLNWDQNTTVRLQLWDIAGQERFGNMTRVYYKEAVAAFIVFDVTRVATFDAVVKWKQDLDSKVQLPDGSQIPCVLLANKCDQQKEAAVNSVTKMDEFCREKGFAGWFETSAKENINIDEAARFLVNKILNNDRVISNGENKDPDKIVLEGGAANKNKKCAC